jgi:hypothetical protein
VVMEKASAGFYMDICAEIKALALKLGCDISDRLSIVSRGVLDLRRSANSIELAYEDPKSSPKSKRSIASMLLYAESLKDD